MPDWLWWALAAYLGIGVVAVVWVERIEGRMPWKIRAAFALLWLPSVVAGVLDG